MISNRKKEKNLYQNEKEKKNKENEKIQPKNKISSSIDKNRFSRKNIFNLSLFAYDFKNYYKIIIKKRTNYSVICAKE